MGIGRNRDWVGAWPAGALVFPKSRGLAPDQPEVMLCSVLSVRRRARESSSSWRKKCIVYSILYGLNYRHGD